MTGCCTGGGISSSALAQLLSGELKNTTVTSSADFDRALKAAVQTGGADAEKVQTALAEGLSLAPAAQVDFTISALESAKAGRQALNVVFEAGSDVNAAALGAAIDWLLVLRGLPQDGQYTAQVGAVRTDGGYILAIHLKVEEPGTLPSEPEPIPEGGYEVIEGVYHVYNEEGLKKWAEAAQKDLSTSCTLERDITLSGEWTPIGNSSTPYTGKFDGNHCTITGLIISSGDYVGLFGYIGLNGRVENLTLANVNISGGWNVGGVVGYNSGTITGCKVEGDSVSGSITVGGVAGLNDGTITACYATGSVSGNSRVGGVVGTNQQVNYVDGTAGGYVTACYHAGGSVSGSTDVGGVVGLKYSGTVTACYWSGSVTGGNVSGDATEVDGTTTTWETAYNAMDKAASGYYKYINETTPPKLKWEK